MTGGPVWTARALAEATGGEVRGAWTGITGLSIDTREIAPGEMFIALAGENRDGHAFVAAALEAGAAAALVSRVPEDVGPDAPLLVVADTMAALQALGRAGRARTEARVIAVTGSVGKTSTKDMLRHMLAAQGRTHAATRSFNNHWGVPLTLARMPADTEFAVIEIGMNHPGEIGPLSEMARPHVALITTVEAVHLAAFGSVEEIADEKGAISAGLEPDGIAVLNADNLHFDRLSAIAAPHAVVGFGRAAPDYRLIEARACGRATVVRAEIEGHATTFKLGAPGVHFAMNALGALAAVAAAGGDVGRAAIALATWVPPAGRGSRAVIEFGPGGTDGSITLLDESYNANPASMRAALAVLAASTVTHDIGRIARGRRIAFLGDMLELGPTETELHADLAALPEIDAIDTVHCCGPRMQALHAALPVQKRGIWCADSEELAEKVRKAVDAGDVCMVKGSLGARMARVVAALKALGTERTDGADGDA